jgi:quercetin dioxygenase-like cupin family protein
MQAQSSLAAGRGAPVTERPLSGPLQVFRNAEVAELLADEMKSPLVGERDSITLRKGDGLSVVRVAVRKGGRIAPHSVAAPFCVVVLSGTIVFTADGREETLRALDVASCDAGVEHGISAVDDAHLLISIAR